MYKPHISQSQRCQSHSFDIIKKQCQRMVGVSYNSLLQLSTVTRIKGAENSGVVFCCCCYFLCVCVLYMHAYSQFL